MAKVILRPAFSWTCPGCRSIRFSRAIVREMASETEQQLRSEQGVEASVEGSFLMKPASVSCKLCAKSFDVKGDH